MAIKASFAIVVNSKLNFMWIFPFIISKEWNVDKYCDESQNETDIIYRQAQAEVVDSFMMTIY